MLLTEHDYQHSNFQGDWVKVICKDDYVLDVVPVSGDCLFRYGYPMPNTNLFVKGLENIGDFIPTTRQEWEERNLFVERGKKRVIKKIEFEEYK